ncbi:MAG TPA: fused MFS/spermidine synthase, partial [Thermodesulfobacteriota bacterium]|nr:fused MFS/spermidine synthase [Thermodesulfobacteriota bacterium]
RAGRPAPPAPPARHPGGEEVLKEPVAASLEQRPQGATGRLNLIILFSFGLSGFCSLSYEVLWTRVFSLVLGSSVYAFTVMLATFLAGIGFGSILFAPVVDRLKRPLLWFAGFEAIIGFTGLFSIFIYRKLPFIFYSLKGSFSGQFWLFQTIQFALCSLIMIIPTLSMGAMFPLVGRLYTRGLSTVGKNIGDIYFTNTTGSIFGSFVGGFILIPVIGVQRGVIATAALNIIIAAVLLNSSGLKALKRGVITAAFAAVFILSTLMLPPWEKMVMTTGVYVNPFKEKELELVKKGRSEEELLFYREGINAVITVRKKGDTVTYQANGKQEASSTAGRPSQAWALLGHIPLLLHGGEPSEALLVGLGSGITLGAMEYYPLETIDVVEIEPAVVEAARFFSEANEKALDDPRARLHITDGRSFLFAKRSNYDVIVSAVSDPWITGVANLFTLEYFEELDRKLNDDGVVALWFQNYRITPKELKIGLNTFAEVFPHVSVWFHYTDALDLIVIGSKKPHGLDIERLRAVFKDEGGRNVRRGLARVEVKEPLDVFDLFLIGDTDIRRYAGETVLNTDERPVFEFTLPKLQYLDPGTGVRTVEELISSALDVAPPARIPDDEKEEFYLALGKSYNQYSFRLAQAYALFEKVLEINPGNAEAARLRDGLKKELNY